MKNFEEYFTYCVLIVGTITAIMLIYFLLKLMYNRLSK